MKTKHTTVYGSFKLNAIADASKCMLEYWYSLGLDTYTQTSTYAMWCVQNRGLFQTGKERSTHQSP